jgi:hypothetical protein
MKFRDGPVLYGGYFVALASPEMCLVRLDSCQPCHLGEEVSVPVASDDANWVRRLSAGQFVWVVYQGQAPVGLTPDA